MEASAAQNDNASIAANAVAAAVEELDAVQIPQAVDTEDKNRQGLKQSAQPADQALALAEAMTRFASELGKNIAQHHLVVTTGVARPEPPALPSDSYDDV